MNQLTDSKGQVLSCSDRVRDEEGFDWWVLSMFPEINSVVGITVNEDRSVVRHFDLRNSPYYLRIKKRGLPLFFLSFILLTLALY